jgi:hypothetical protein
LAAGAGDPVGELLFDEGALLAGARWLQALGLLAALVWALVLIVRRPTLGVDRRRLLPGGRRDLRGAQVRPQPDDAGRRRGARLARAP